MKKLLFGIFICLGSIFVMSQNVNALDLNFENYSIQHSYRLPNIRCNTTQGSRIDVRSCSLPVNNYMGSFNVSGIYINEPFDKSTLKPGDVFEFYIAIKTKGNNALLSGSFSLQAQTPAQGNNFTPLGYELIDTQDFLTYTAVEQNLPGEDYGFVSDFWSSDRVVKVYKITHVYTGTGTGTALVGLADATTYLFTLYSYENDIYEISMPLVNHYRFEGSNESNAAQKEMESADNIENQSPPSSSETGDGAQATNLIGAFSGFVTALGGLSATNCNLTLNFPTFAGGSRVVNVCQNKDKAGNIISVFSSLTLIIFYVPLAIRLLTMIYNEIRSFTNG